MCLRLVIITGLLTRSACVSHTFKSQNLFQSGLRLFLIFIGNFKIKDGYWLRKLKKQFHCRGKCEVDFVTTCPNVVSLYEVSCAFRVYT